jgi:hypothetical protein
MRRLVLGSLIALLAAAPAAAADYKLVIEPGQGKMLKGRAGLHSLDINTDKTMMRVISPGARITKRGTVRVLLINRGQQPFEFGPDQVSLVLPDGTELAEVPVNIFDKGEKLVEREVRIAGATDRAAKAGLAAAAEAASSGLTVGTVSGRGLDGADVRSQSLRHDSLEDALPGARLLGGLNHVLRPLTVGPNEAWGGYLVFDMPKALQKGRTDQPLTIVIRTGREVHRVRAVLDRI